MIPIKKDMATRFLPMYLNYYKRGQGNSQKTLGKVTDS